MLSSDLTAGDQVEVLKRDCVSGQVTYYPATVLRSPAKQQDKILIEYQTITNGAIPARELVESVTVRPVPPLDYGAWFKVDDDVDVHSDSGWHRGIVKGILVNSKYLVRFARRSEGIVSEQCTLRHHREWIDGAWSPPPPPPVQLTQREPKSRKVNPKVKLEKKMKKEKSETMLLVEGSKVEVKSDDVGFQGAWFGGVIVDHVGEDNYLVEFLHLMTEDQTGPLREVVNVDDVRPYPPDDDQSLTCYKYPDKVGAWYNDGWWEGMILRVVDGSDDNYVVYFSTTGDFVEFQSLNLRPHLDWINGEWFKEKVGDNEEELKRNLKSSSSSYGIGMKVEVKSDEAGYQGAWFVGVIVAVKENDRFLVQYDNLLTDDETDYLKEEVNACDVRPRPPQVPVTHHYGLLDVVDAWSNDAWWVGSVIRVYQEMKYRVLFPANEELEFEHSQLRPHLEWTGSEWYSVPKDWGF